MQIGKRYGTTWEGNREVKQKLLKQPEGMTDPLELCNDTLFSFHQSGSYTRDIMSGWLTTQSGIHTGLKVASYFYFSSTNKQTRNWTQNILMQIRATVCTKRLKIHSFQRWHPGGKNWRLFWTLGKDFYTLLSSHSENFKWPYKVKYLGNRFNNKRFAF